MSSGRVKKPASKRRKWNQKKKTGEAAKNPNRGLPGRFIKTYGDPVERTLITGKVWEQFYGSDAGKERATKLAARYAGRLAEQTKHVMITQADIAAFAQNDVAKIARENEVAKGLARRN